MIETRMPIPARAYNAAVGGHVCGPEDVDFGQKVVHLIKYDKDGNEVSFESQVTQANKIYVIHDDFTLNSNVTIPANCVLEFDGGSLSGAYTITGNNTVINAGLVKIFNTNVTLAGTWNIVEAYPEWFGAKGDGVTENLSAIQKCIDSFDEIFISKGTYIITDENNFGLIVTSNKTIRGAGKESEIRYNQSSSSTGDVICIAGSNIVIDSINPTYINPYQTNYYPFFKDKGNMGAIGISNGDPRNPLLISDRKNIIVKNIISDVSYIVQTENAVGYNIENVIYDNIIAPYSVISMTANENGGIRDSRITNCVCGILRTGWGYSSNIEVSNVSCKAIRGGSDGVSFNNINIEFDEEIKSRIYTWNDGDIQNSFWGECAYFTGDILSNVSVVNKYSGSSVNGLVVDGNPSIVTNCKSNSFDAEYFNVRSTNAETVFCNCDFTSTTGSSRILGKWVACKLGTLNGGNPVYFDSSKAYESITPLSSEGWAGWSNYYPNGINVRNNIAHLTICFDYVGDNLISGTRIFDIASFIPNYEVHGVGFLKSKSDNSLTPVNVTIENDGKAKILATFGTFPTSNVYLFIDMCYPL